MAYIHQDFLMSPRLQHSVRDNILSILNNVDSQPAWYPLIEAFWYTLIEPVKSIRQRIDAPDTGSANHNLGFAYWAIIWEIATISTAGGLENLSRKIQKFVFPLIR